MTTLVRSIRRYGLISSPKIGRSFKRIGPVVALAAVISAIPDGWSIAAQALSDAYIAVSVFVAGTLALVFAAERALKTDLGNWLERYQRWQVPAAALLGAFPGCGGAIVAITQYTRGYLSFGGVVATLTATMGDAMFLLLAKEPGTAVGILILGVVVGIISGYIVDAIHGPAFMRPAQISRPAHSNQIRPWTPVSMSLSDRFWLFLMIPGVILGILAAFQVDVDELVSIWIPASPAFWIGVIGSILALSMWVQSGEAICNNQESCADTPKPITRSVIDDTNFITTWVIFAFIGYEIMVAASGVDMSATLAVWGPLVPAMAILMGFIPGCGPQIMVTSLYLSGSISLSAQLGNAIANDGDALFPAIAVAPKAAIVATLYSALPAILVAYGWWTFME